MDCAKKVMEPGEMFLLRFISRLKEHAGDAWIRKYIFPGGTVPSLQEMISCAADVRREVYPYVAFVFVGVCGNFSQWHY